MSDSVTQQGQADFIAESEIRIIGDPVLRASCEDAKTDAETRLLAERMTRLLRALKGAGLAAPQVGVSKKLIVVEVRKTELFPERPESPLYIMLNPTIVRASASIEEGWEGCFSIPNLLGRVPRSTSITLRYMTLEGIPTEAEFEGYLARVIQHECDHLAGMFFLDRMRSLKSLSSVANYKRYHAEHC